MANNGQTADLLANSVTAEDAGKYTGNGVVNYIIPWTMLSTYSIPLPYDLPPYWTINLGLANYWSRDKILRSTIMHETFWSYSIFKAASMVAAKSWTVDGRGADRYHQMFVDWGGDGYVPSMERGMLDYLTTNNGEHWEIVRSSSASGSRILGLVHLDSLRCVRTGDADTPIIFWDLKGKWHELKDYQVFSLVDMPDPSSVSLGIGHCAAERAYPQIYKQAAIEQYLREKVTGTGASVLDIIGGMNPVQLEQLITNAKTQSEAKGFNYYQGHILAGVLSQVDLEHIEIELRKLPDGFDRVVELEVSQMAYAGSIGLDPQEINPRLVGKSNRGTSAQSEILDSKQSISGIAARDKQLTQLLNQQILPSSVTFAFQERDLRDEQLSAEVELTRETKRASMISSGQITPAQGLQMAVDDKDAPPEFLPQPDQTPNDNIDDEEKPLTEAELSPAAQPAQTAPIEPVAPPAVVKERARRLLPSRALAELTQAINNARIAIRE